MKMTIEEKAKRYDEALEKAKQWHNDPHITIGLKGNLEDIFPELKESEGDESKKWILEYLYDGMRKSEEQFKGQFKAAIDWFEKQCKKDSQVICPTFTFDDILALQCCMATANNIQEDKELYEQLKSLHDRLHDAYWLEKQGLEPRKEGSL